MNFEDLLKNKKIERVEKEEIDFSKVEYDLKSARDSFNSGNIEWAMSIAYHAILRVGRSLMFSMGYRPIGKEHHKNVFEFLKKCEIDQQLIKYFDIIRIKRNEFIYRNEINISQTEAKETIEKAEIFVLKIRTFVRKIRTGSKND